MWTSIEENFNFMVLEILKQVEDTQRAVSTPNEKLINKIDDRDAYIDTLNGLIQTKCFSFSEKTSAKRIEVIKAIDTISRNLERIGDYSVSIVRQMNFYSDKKFIHLFDFKFFFLEAVRSLRNLNSPITEWDVPLALKICRCEYRIDEKYSEVLKDILARMGQNGANIQNLVTTLFIFGYLERMGDALQNIGEAILSMSLGQKIKIHDYITFQAAAKSSGLPLNIDDEQVVFQSIGETRSGCRISRVERQGASDSKQGMIFKEGNINKIIKEKENLELWGRLFPGVPPRVFGFEKSNRDGALLLEYLQGVNMRDLILEGSVSAVEEGITQLHNFMRSVWTLTRQEKVGKMNAVTQLMARLDDVYNVHYNFKGQKYQVGGLEIPNLEAMLRENKAIEQKLSAPFSVLIHGDFNVDNIIYDEVNKQVHIFDLYRSTYMDYVQDVSVFLVSNFRLPFFDPKIRQRLNRVILLTYQFAKEFAKEVGDWNFEVRLAFGLSRSFITSTRFILDENFAKVLFQRGIYLQTKIYQNQKQILQGFSIPEEILVYEEM